MERLLVIIAIVSLVWLPMSAGAGDFVRRNEIIETLGGTSVTNVVKRSVAKTRDIDRVVRGFMIKEKSDSVAVTKHLALNLYFKINSAELQGDFSYMQLAELGYALASEELDHISVRISGHTCDLGSSQHNRVLSQKRADRIRQNLIQIYNVSPSRLEAEGYGEDYPNVTNTSEANRRLNRRVVIERIE